MLSQMCKKKPQISVLISLNKIHLQLYLIHVVLCFIFFFILEICRNKYLSKQRISKILSLKWKSQIFRYKYISTHFLTFGGSVFLTIYIPMKTNCAPLFAALFLNYIEVDVIHILLRKKEQK